MSDFADIDKIFTSECSSRTVQANENGFFKNFYYTIVDSFKTEDEWKNWLKNQFGKLESDEEKLQLLFNDPSVSWDILGTLEHVTEIYRKKDSMFSWQKREQVMKLLKQHDTGNCSIGLDKILILASQAVMRGPMKDVDKDIDNGLTLCLALMTRSEVFFKMNDGLNGLNDLQLAVKCGLPVRNNPDYYAKLAKFYAMLNEEKKCEISIKLYHQLLGCDDHRKKLLENETNDIKARMESLACLMQHKKFQRKPLPTLNREESSETLTEAQKCTSKSLQLVESPEAGKYFIANGEIGTAETLLVEKAKCACLYPKNFGTHCYHCFARLVAPIGCTECASVAFCSTDCRDIALSTYHKYECKYLDMMIGSGMSILCHLALRLVLQTGTPEKAIEEGKKLTVVLCKNSKMRSNEDFFKRCLMTTFLLRCLQKSEFFGRRTTESAEPTSLEMEVGTLLFAYLQALQFNAHEIAETVSSGHKFIKSRINYIGVGIYEVGAMFNHECYPSITRYFNSTYLIFNSIRPHAKGEIIAENYGPIFTKQTLQERQRNLASRYWFKCSCQACKENWPVLDKLNNKCRIRCPDDSCKGFFNYPQDYMKQVKCRVCKKNVSLQMSVNLLLEAEDLFEQGAVHMDAENVNDAVQSFKTGIEIFHKVALPPHRDLHIAQESLRACLSTEGNTFEL
ncbi:CLUMA_CG019432, isoform A [Clunio marinus]|uniref:CLUMA_CG019432, isoform A n=1 Tax=Clunio marinus TaxID=568069 RepID=A0A1J1J3W6_9DIPT|nr:CLUMA_CG019432, isoform A [Clunio marinus]